MSKRGGDTNEPPKKAPDLDLTHMPQYIKQAPWYLEQKDQEVLTHQRARNDGVKASINDTWYRRGVQTQQVTKYRKGSCTNCGAMTHDVKTCTERPRKISVKYNQRDFAQDEMIVQNQLMAESKLNFEAKRDRWNGYDPNAFKQVVEEWNQINEEQRKRKEQEIQEKLQKKAEKAAKGEAYDSFEDSDSSSGNDDPDIEKDSSNRKNVDEDPRKRTITRELRIREDTAKYLRNLDPNSAAYSGKSRTMNENPNPEKAGLIFQGDNMAKFSGDFLKYMNQEAFTLESSEAGVEVNHVAMPSQVEILHKQFKEKKDLLKQKKMQELIDKYGGEKHLLIPEDLKDSIDPNDIEVMNQTLEPKAKEFQVPDLKYVQKSKTQEQPRGIVGIMSKYQEDIHEQGHSTVWGSYWHPVLGWGYKCCFSFDKNSKCNGEEGKI